MVPTPYSPPRSGTQRGRAASRPPGRQRGWVGLIVLLLAIVIVAMLGKTVLQQMLGSAAPPPVGPAAQRTPLAPVETPADTAAAPLPQAPVERARAVEGIVQRQFEATKRDVDAATR